MAGGGFGDTAFVIDAYAGLIPGWEMLADHAHRVRRTRDPRRGDASGARRAPVDR